MVRTRTVQSLGYCLDDAFENIFLQTTAGMYGADEFVRLKLK